MAKVGRFISADSIIPDPFNPQAFNRYSYVINAPVKYNDPTGHSYGYEGISPPTEEQYREWEMRTWGQFNSTPSEPAKTEEGDTSTSPSGPLSNITSSKIPETPMPYPSSGQNISGSEVVGILSGSSGLTSDPVALAGNAAGLAFTAIDIYQNDFNINNLTALCVGVGSFIAPEIGITYAVYQANVLTFRAGKIIYSDVNNTIKTVNRLNNNPISAYNYIRNAVGIPSVGYGGFRFDEKRH